jgi:hypothetical protein
MTYPFREPLIYYVGIPLDYLLIRSFRWHLLWLRHRTDVPAMPYVIRLWTGMQYPSDLYPDFPTLDAVVFVKIYRQST